MRRPLRWWPAVLVLAVLLAPPSPVRADAARPGDTRSQVDRLEPATTGVTLDIVGGDAFLRLRVEPGHEVVVLGYGGEPYLRISADGTVEENTWSPAVALNEDRYGNAVDLPPTPDPDQEPDWRAVGAPGNRGGEALWHDHRVHWMARSTPPTISPDGLVQRWEVPMIVDQVPVVVQGSLYRVDGPSVLWWLLSLPVAGLVLWAARRSTPSGGMVAAGVAVVAAGLFVVITHLMPHLRLPAVARGAPVTLLLAGVAVILGVVSLVWRPHPYQAALVGGAGAGLVLTVWTARLTVTAGVVPAADPAWPVRVAVVVALGVGVAVVVMGVSGALRVPANPDHPA
jgi:hypothetical protein